MTFPGLNTSLTLGAALAHQAQVQGDKVACTFLHADQLPQQLTYRQLHDQANRYAAYLRANAIGAGDILILAGQHDLALFVAVVGAFYVGAVPSIFPYMARYDSTAIYLQRLRDRATPPPICAVLISSPLQALAANELAETNSLVLVLDPFNRDTVINTAVGCKQETEDRLLDTRPATAPGYLQFSSGTTGEAKGALVSHGAALRYVDAFARALDLQTTDVLVGWPPFHHDLGLVGYLLFPLLTGIHLVTMPPDFWVRQPHILLRAIHDYRGTLSMLPNFAFAHITRVVRDDELAGLKLSTMRWFMISAEMINPQIAHQFQARFHAYGLPAGVVCAAYGMAECVLAPILGQLGQGVRSDAISKQRLVGEQLAQPLAGDDIRESETIEIADCGLPIANTTVTIVDDEGRPVPERQIGEIVLRSPFLFDGYLEQPALTAKTLRDGGLYTGDLGYCVNGQLFVVGRKQDLIITAGKNIYPESIERIALTLLGQLAIRAAAFGIRDEGLGTEFPVLVCELRAEMTEALQAHYRQQIRWRVQQELDSALADVQLVPRRWIAVTTSGKVARAASRAKYLAAGFAPQPLDLLPPDLPRQSAAEIETTLGLFFGDTLGGTGLAPTDNLFEAGISSLLLAQSLAKLEQTYASRIPIEQFVQQPTIAQLAQFLTMAQPATPTAFDLPDLPLIRQPYSKNRRLNHFLNDGLPGQQRFLPYALGVRIQRAWLQQRWVQTRFFQQPLTLVKYMASQVGERNPQEAILRSLMCNIWAYWRIHHLSQPATFARWCTVHSPHAEWPPKPTARGVIYALTHTPDSYCFAQALQHYGMVPTVITWGQAPGLAPQQIQTLQVYQAQQRLRQGGNVVIFADALTGSGGITVDFWGSRRSLRPGMAALAEATGATILPVFSSFATTGEVTFEITAPLVAYGNTAERRIEACLVHYAELLRSRWAQLYSNLWWRFLR